MPMVGRGGSPGTQLLPSLEISWKRESPLPSPSLLISELLLGI